MVHLHPTLDLSTEEQMELGKYAIDQICHYLEHTDEVNVSPELNPTEIVQYAEQIDFHNPVTPKEAVHYIVEGLRRYQVHTAHPGYYGLFNPRPNFMGIVADAITAAFNPQLAVWSHAPLAVEIENYVLREFAVRFGYPRETSNGTFTTGGAEANLTAVLTALCDHFPEYTTKGLASLDKPPVMYASSESHHSLVKAARACGLGTDSIRSIRSNASLQMDAEALALQIQQDREAGFAPFLIVATAGTTGAGAIDPIADIAELAEQEKIWLHVDAAYGGAMILAPELGNWLQGINRADSITFDAHKWLSVPMGAGMYFTRHPHILQQTFRMTADYMPKEGTELESFDPYTHSIQWSRRFIGLKLYMSLATAGWEGYRLLVRRQIERGNFLRQELERSGWSIMNDTIMPVVCFNDQAALANHDLDFVRFIHEKVLATGKAWISIFTIQDTPALRACITNFDTTEQHMIELIHLLNAARQEYMTKIPSYNGMIY